MPRWRLSRLYEVASYAASTAACGLTRALAV